MADDASVGTGASKQPGQYDLSIRGGREVPTTAAARGGVAGAAAADDDGGLGRFAEVVKTRVATEVRVEASRAATSGPEPQLDGLAPDTVLELELEGGVVWWTTVAELAELLAEGAVMRHRGDEPVVRAEPLIREGVLEIPPSLPFGSRERGAGGLLLRVLRRVDVDLSGLAAAAVARKLEDRLEPGPGLYRCPRPDALGPRIGEAAEVPGGGPLLVLLHGTASSTAGSFGGLVREERMPQWQRLTGRFGDRLLALEHRTLSQSPAQNALDLARLLPAESEVHLLSHSRGGLVGELLCRGCFGGGRTAFTDAELEAFAGEARRADREALRDLRQVLEEKRLRITRFVRVACPARGTLLASKRLDRYLSLMLNGLGLVVGDRLNPAYQFLKALTIALAKERADPAELPGLEAQMPGSPLIRVLNDKEGINDADLTVIAGDVEGSGLLGRLKIFATDLFFRRDHDLVVDSAAMFGGARRSPDHARYMFEKGTETSHFNYFANASTNEALVTALTTAGREVAGFRPLEVGRTPEGVRGLVVQGVVEPGKIADLDPQRPVVVLLPGIMGSRLKVGDNVVWVDLSDLVKGRFLELAVRDGDGVASAGLLERGYRTLVRFLADSHEVVPLDFDWRRDLDRAAARLAGVLEELLGATQQPVRLLAHSMGGLVVRRMRTLKPALWKRLLQRPGFRFVMLGTPNGGSHAIAGILLGQEKLLRMLLLVGPDRETRAAVSGFPGIVSMLPPTANVLSGKPGEDLYQAATWSAWRAADDEVVVPTQEALDKVRALREALDKDPLDDEPVIYLAGQSAAGTPFAVQQVVDGFGRTRLRLKLSPKGDGRVLWQTGIPKPVEEGRRVWYAAGVSHGALATEKRIFPAIRELLEQGRTALLAQEAPRLRGVAEGSYAVEQPLLLPDEEDLVAAALGFEPQLPAEVREADRMRVVVSFGSLAFARGPVTVGHYERDVIASAESFIDSLLAGALRRRHDLGLYPGPVGTGESVLDADDPTRGALVAGLGPVGELTPERISRGVRQAVMRYATTVAALKEWPLEDVGGRRRLRLSSLLIGAGQGTGISIDDSLQAVIQGVGDALSLLRQVLGDEAPRLEELEVVELYEHRALCAAEALQRLARLPGADVELDAEPLLRTIEGGQRDIPCSDSGWYRRLQIVQDAEPAPPGGAGRGAGPGTGGGEEACGADLHGLRFTSLTERARAEVRLLATQRRLVERFVQSSIGDSTWRPAAAQTLFELLIPNDLKSYAPDERDLLLVLDRHSAGYPWELVSDAQDRREPLSVRAGMLRQLASGNFRERPLVPTERTALVVGDPPTGNPRFPPLPGARSEAKRVAAELAERGWSVEAQIGTSPESVVTALFTRPYRLIHIAAHGIYDPRCPQASGVVLDEGMLLTAAEIGQLRQVPELAFINCCNLGRIEGVAPELVGHRNLLAANLGLELIQIGVRAVVVAGWVVDDAAADTFAGELYAALLAGDAFGDAVKRARRETYRYFPETNTWGAYQCYGDPSYRLVTRRREAGGRTPTWVSPVRLVHQLENLRSRARTGSSPRRLRGEIEALETALVTSYPAWMQHGGVREALGRAWAELADVTAWRLADGGSGAGEPSAAEASGSAEATRAEELRAFDKAVENLRAALACEDGQVGLDVRAELTNLEVRGATVRWRLERRHLERRLRELAGGQRELEGEAKGEGEDAKRAAQRLAEMQAEAAVRTERLAEVDAEAADEIGRRLADLRAHAAADPTSRRLTWVGSAAKRLAAVRGEERGTALDEAIEAYRGANDQSRATCGRIAPYPAGNWALLKVVMRLAKGSADLDGVEPLLDELVAPRLVASYWNRLEDAQVHLVRGLLDLATKPNVDAAPIVEAWKRAERGSRSRFQLAAVLESLDTLSDLLDERWVPSKAGSERLARAQRLVRQVRCDLVAEVDSAQRRGGH